MSKLAKIILVAAVGFFFSIATLEIDFPDYDNTFFDSYDFYLQADNLLSHPGGDVDQDCFAPSAMAPSWSPISVTLPARCEVSHSKVYPHKRKLYLIKSSLLI